MKLRFINTVLNGSVAVATVFALVCAPVTAIAADYDGGYYYEDTSYGGGYDNDSYYEDTSYEDDDDGSDYYYEDTSYTNPTSDHYYEDTSYVGHYYEDTSYTTPSSNTPSGGGGGSTSTPKPAPTCTMTASPKTVAYGQGSTLSWSTTNTASVTISGGSNNNLPVAKAQSAPTNGLIKTTTYTITVKGTNGGSINCATTVTVTPKPTPTCTLTASPTTIKQGEQSMLVWKSTNGTSATLTGRGSVGLNNNLSVSPSQTTTYTFTVTGQGSTVTCTKTITVTPKPAAPTCTITANPANVQKGNGSTLSWTSTNATSAKLNGGGNTNTPVAPAQSAPTGALNQNTTYTLTVTGPGGSANCSKTITVTEVPVTHPAPTCTITGRPATIQNGMQAMLDWSSTNGTSASLSGVGAVGLTDLKVVQPSHTTTYVITITGKGGTVTCTTTITVTNPQPNAPTCTMSADKTSISPGQAVTLTWNSNNTTHGVPSWSGVGSVPSNGSVTVYPTQDTTYTGTFYGQGGTVTCTTTVHVSSVTYPAPSCTIIINNNYNSNSYAPNQAVVIAWSSHNAHTGWVNQNVGNVNLSGSRTVYPTQTTTYTATFTGQNGQTVNCSVTVNVNNYIPPVNPGNPYITLSAVPYTGLELGPVGTLAYWGFLILWCLFAAYLLVVKRVQNSIYASFKRFLFGRDAHTEAHDAQDVVSRGLFSTADLEVIANTLRTVIEGPQKDRVAHATHAPLAPQGDVIDEFVLSQINRTRHN